MQAISQSMISVVDEKLGVKLSQKQIEQFGHYQALLLSWNKRINLTAVRTSEGIEQIHFLDSLSVLISTGSLENCSLIDVGSGAGFPGLPLKIIYPTLRLTLVESIQKKGAFLNEVVKSLGLNKVMVLSERAETLANSIDHRGQYDWAVARAVAELPVLIEYLAPFCRLNGRFLAMKGPDYVSEMQAAQNALTQLNVEFVSETRVPDVLSGGKERHLILLKKKGVTPDHFPRRPGMAVKRPL